MIKDESVWYEQIDTALVNLLSTLTVKDSNGEILVPSWVRKPDEDFKVESYPSTSIYCISSAFDYDRFSNQTISKYNESAGKCEIYHPVLPFKFQYQIDFWAKYQTHRNSMIAQWLQKHVFGTRINLPVVDTSGAERTANMSMTGSILNQDEVSGTQRTFRAIFTYNIWAELDNVNQEIVPAILQNSISLKNKIQED